MRQKPETTMTAASLPFRQAPKKISQANYFCCLFSPVTCLLNAACPRSSSSGFTQFDQIWKLKTCYSVGPNAQIWK